MSAAFERWRAPAIGVGIFSSGSVLAQQLLFRHSIGRRPDGLATLVLRYRRSARSGTAASYRRIAEAMEMPAGAILFVSDVVEELDAARAAGMQTRLSEQAGKLTGFRRPHARGRREIR